MKNFVSRTGTLLVAVAVVAALAACVSAPAAAGPFQFEAKAVSVASRGVSVPAVLTVPATGKKALARKRRAALPPSPRSWRGSA